MNPESENDEKDEDSEDDNEGDEGDDLERKCRAALKADKMLKSTSILNGDNGEGRLL